MSNFICTTFCPECNREFKSSYALNSHLIWHKPEYVEKMKNRDMSFHKLKCKEYNDKQKQAKVDNYNLNPKFCPECSKKLKYENKRTFCNSSCSAKFNNLIRSNESRNKQKQNIIKTLSKIPKEVLQERAKRATKSRFKNKGLEYNVENYYNNCIVCNIKMYRRKTCSKHRRKTCSKQCLSTLRSNKMIERNKKHNFGGFKHKQIKYKEIYLDSTWELKVAQSLDENNIKWVRPKFIKWVDKENKVRRYFPDFYLLDYNVYLDPKNPFAKKVQKDKLICLKEQIKIPLLILNKNELNWETIKNKIMVGNDGTSPPSSACKTEVLILN